MAGDTNKKQANLRTFMLVQDFAPEHWDWTPDELKSLGDISAMGKVVLKRLQSAGLEVAEAYAIAHDKDERDLWREYEDVSAITFASNHIHIVCKLSRGDTLEAIAKFLGVAPNFIAKPRTGRYSYDNMLSYLIHIKYPKKFQYAPQDVITIAGKEYIEYFNARYNRWMHGRAVKILADAEYDLKDVKRMIMEGEIDKRDLLTDDRFKYVYQSHMDSLDKLLEAHERYVVQRNMAINKEGRFSDSYRQQNK